MAAKKKRIIMKFRFTFAFIAIAGLLGALSCSREVVPTVDERETVEVSLEVLSPDALTKAEIGDGSKATELYYTAFVDGRSIPSFQRKAVLENGRTTLKLTLIKNVVYDFIFWAQAPVAAGQTAPYDLSEFYTEGLVKADYSVAANDDSRDAFFASKSIDTNYPVNDPVELYRPFAQVNFAAADYDELKYVGLHQGLQSKALIKGLPDVLDCRTGEVSSSGNALVDASFTYALTPSARGGEDEYVTVSGLTCGYVGMNYVFSDDDGENVTVTGDFLWTNPDATKPSSSWTTSQVPNVPVKRNHKTFILGNFFIENNILDIVIIPGFEDDEIVTM